MLISISDFQLCVMYYMKLSLENVDYSHHLIRIIIKVLISSFSGMILHVIHHNSVNVFVKTNDVIKKSNPQLLPQQKLLLNDPKSPEEPHLLLYHDNHHVKKSLLHHFKPVKSLLQVHAIFNKLWIVIILSHVLFAIIMESFSIDQNKILYKVQDNSTMQQKMLLKDVELSQLHHSINYPKNADNSFHYIIFKILPNLLIIHAK